MPNLLTLIIIYILNLIYSFLNGWTFFSRRTTRTGTVSHEAPEVFVKGKIKIKLSIGY